MEKKKNILPIICIVLLILALLLALFFWPNKDHTNGLLFKIKSKSSTTVSTTETTTAPEEETEAALTGWQYTGMNNSYGEKLYFWFDENGDCPQYFPAEMAGTDEVQIPNTGSRKLIAYFDVYSLDNNQYLYHQYDSYSIPQWEIINYDPTNPNNQYVDLVSYNGAGRWWGGCIFEHSSKSLDQQIKEYCFSRVKEGYDIHDNYNRCLVTDNHNGYLYPLDYYYAEYASAEEAEELNQFGYDVHPGDITVENYMTKVEYGYNYCTNCKKWHDYYYMKTNLFSGDGGCPRCYRD